MKEFDFNTFLFALPITILGKRMLTFWRNELLGKYYNFFVLAFDIYCVDQRSK